MIEKALKILQTASQPGKLVKRNTVVFKQLMDLLDHPYNHFKSVHITGTNGKGSTSLKIAAILQAEGYKTGLFTSPHILEFFQRIKVNQTNIEDQYFAQTILRLEKIRLERKMQISFFQYLTATAFLYFKDTNCDFASIQVGLGGRFDTTNVITPQLSVITSISIDHEKILGNTRQKIAYEKSGIIKPSIPVLIGPNAELEIIFQQAKKNKSAIHLLNKKHFQTFDDQNIAISKQAIKVLQGRGISISNRAIQQGIKYNQPCRMQVIGQGKLPQWLSKKRVILDVGHNPDAINKIIEYYNKKLRKGEKQTITVIFGSSKEKNSMESLQMLQKFADIIYLVSANHRRAMPIHELKQCVGFMKYPQKYRVISEGQIEKAMTYASADLSTDTILVCGSFFIMPEVRQFLKIDQRNQQNLRTLTQNYDLKNSKN